MNIVFGRPPNYGDIVRVFPSAIRDGTIFTYGDTVYLTGGQALSDELQAHESVHMTRQLAHGGPGQWWERYLTDPQFRLKEEILGHRAEYRAFKERARDRNQVSKFLTHVAMRLSSPLYGSICTLAEARKEISG